jgi:hypothetical protein
MRRDTRFLIKHLTDTLGNGKEGGKKNNHSK